MTHRNFHWIVLLPKQNVTVNKVLYKVIIYAVILHNPTSNNASTSQHHALLPTSAQPTCSLLTTKPITQRNPTNHSTAFVNTNVIDCSSKSPKSPPPFISHNTSNAIFNWCFNHQTAVSDCHCTTESRGRMCENVLANILSINRLLSQCNTKCAAHCSVRCCCSVAIRLESWSMVPL